MCLILLWFRYLDGLPKTYFRKLEFNCKVQLSRWPLLDVPFALRLRVPMYEVMYNFFNAQSKPRDAPQLPMGLRRLEVEPCKTIFRQFRWNFGRTPRRMHSVRAGCSYFLVTSPRAISIIECSRKINTQISCILLSTFESIFTDFSR